MKDFKEFCNETLIPVLLGMIFAAWYIITLPFDIIRDILVAVWANLHARVAYIIDLPDMVEEWQKL